MSRSDPAANSDEGGTQGDAEDIGSHDRGYPLARFAEQVDHLTVGELALLCDTWDADDETVRRQAWLEVRARADETGRSSDLRELQDGLVRWAGVPGRSGLMPFSVLVPSLREEAAERRRSLAPLLDAGAALLLRDQLSRDSFAALTHPWRVLLDGWRDAQDESRPTT